MPEIYFRILWPDAAETDHYSPSQVVKDYFALGQQLEVAKFLELIRMALSIASDRVEAKYGFPCSRAAGSLREIEHLARPFLLDSGAAVSVVEFSP
jgi:uncharacterized repeat protein (TIGR04042 family)